MSNGKGAKKTRKPFMQLTIEGEEVSGKKAITKKRATKSSHDKVTFKPYHMDNQLKLPMDLSVMVPNNHLARVVSYAIDTMDLTPVLARYKPGGTSAFHPRMMLKVLVYAYCNKIFSSRMIEKALWENIYFMWLAGNNKPDHQTINRFRSVTLKGIIDEVFAEVLEYLFDQGFIKCEDYFLDGTKIEANARKTTHVWAKSVKRYKKNLLDKVRQLLLEIEQLNKSEDEKHGNDNFLGLSDGPIDAAKLTETVKRIDESLADKEVDAKTKSAVRTLKKEIPRLEKYEQQEAILDGRNSYSKTDPDATFMRMKEDSGNTGDMKAAYNVQIATENQFIIAYDIHQSSSDAASLIPSIKRFSGMTGRLPKRVTADAAYGSQEAYEFLEAQGIDAYVKHQEFHREEKPAFRDDPFRPVNMPYDEEKDEFTCPMGVKLRLSEIREETTSTGFRSERKVYISEGCEGCPERSRCSRGTGDRSITVSFRGWELRAKASALLRSEEGLKQRSLRSCDVESVFGNTKHNMGFRRFLLRTLGKVSVEWGLVCISHNLLKVACIRQGRPTKKKKKA